MGASTRTLPDSQLKTVQTCSSLAPRFFTRKIMRKPLASCAANEHNERSLSLAYFGRLACHYRLGFFGRFGHHFVSLRDAHNFFNGCSALGDTAPAVLPQSLHTFCN